MSEAPIINQVSIEAIDAAQKVLRDILQTKFFECARDGNVIGLARAVEAGTDINARDDAGFTAVIWAAAKNQPALLEAVVALGGDINAKNNDGNTALILAAWYGNTAALKAAFALGGDINAKNNDGFTAMDLVKNNRDLSTAWAINKIVCARSSPGNASAGPLPKPVMKVLDWMLGQ